MRDIPDMNGVTLTHGPWFEVPTGRMAYEMYRKKQGPVDVDGTPLPEWSAMTEDERAVAEGYWREVWRKALEGVGQ